MKNTKLLKTNTMLKTFKEYLNYMGGFRLGYIDNISPMASLGDKPPKGQAGKDSRGVGLHATYSTQAAGTMRPFLTANVEKKKIEMMKLTRQAMSIMPGSKRQKDIIKKLNIVRKDLKLEPVKEYQENQDKKLIQKNIVIYIQMKTLKAQYTALVLQMAQRLDNL